MKIILPNVPAESAVASAACEPLQDEVDVSHMHLVYL